MSNKEENEMQLSQPYFLKITGGLIKCHENQIAPGQIIVSTLQEYLELVKQAQNDGIMGEQFDEIWAHRFGFKTTDGKIISIEMGCCFHVPFRSFVDGRIPNIGLTLEEVFPDTAEALSDIADMLLSRWFCDMEFMVIDSMRSSEGRRMVLGLSHMEEPGIYFEFEDETSSNSEKYAVMWDVAHFNENPTAKYDEVGVECLDTLFSEMQED